MHAAAIRASAHHHHRHHRHRDLTLHDMRSQLMRDDIISRHTSREWWHHHHHHVIIIIVASSCGDGSP
jgi:hypothetical protein